MHSTKGLHRLEPRARARGRILIALILGFTGVFVASRETLAAEPAPGCLGLGIGLLNSYFDLPWSGSEAGKFAETIKRPSAAAYWGLEQQNSAGRATSRLAAHGGIEVTARGTSVAIFQPVEAPQPLPGYAYVIVDVLARVFVKSGIVAISLSNGPASYAASNYPRSPFRTAVNGQWTTVGEQFILGANSPIFDRVSILTLTASAEFSIGCITFIANQRNIGRQEANPLTKGAMVSPAETGAIMNVALVGDGDRIGLNRSVNPRSRFAIIQQQ